MCVYAGALALAGALGCSSSSPAKPQGDAGRDSASDVGPATDSKASDARPGDAKPGDSQAHDGSSDAGTDAAPDGPRVTDITLSPPALVPPFSTSVHDYYVRCAAGTSSLTVTMTAAPGSTIALTEPKPGTAASTDTTTTVSVAENDALVATVTTGSDSEDYWVRCLPHDFPKFELTFHEDAGAPPPGYYLFGGFDPATGAGTYAIVMDGNGVPVWYHATGGAGAVNVDNLSPGTISWDPYEITSDFAPIAVPYEVHDLDAETVAKVSPPGDDLDMHELRLLPNGDYLVLATPVVTGVNLTGLGTYGANESIYDCVVQEVGADGGVVWQWDASDHFDPVKDTTWPIAFGVDGGTVVDTYHCNSIDVDADGDLLISSRHMDSVFLVSRQTGAVLWKMGGSKYSKDDASYIAVTQDPATSFYRQHDARLQPGGQVSMFDDQTAIKGGVARAVVYSYSVDAGTASMVWESKGQEAAISMGSFRILEDGSRVIDWGVGMTQPFVFTEVNDKGDDLLDFSFTGAWAGEASYRTVKVPLNALDIGLLRRTAGKP